MLILLIIKRIRSSKRYLAYSRLCLSYRSFKVSMILVSGRGRSTGFLSSLKLAKMLLWLSGFGTMGLMLKLSTVPLEGFREKPLPRKLSSLEKVYLGKRGRSLSERSLSSLSF